MTKNAPDEKNKKKTKSTSSSSSSKYLPKQLTPADRKRQARSIAQGTVRPHVESFKSRRSKHVRDFENKYNFKITDRRQIHRDLLTDKGIEKVLDKGRAAYFTSGSRPNQTPESWALARLASVLLGRKSFEVDRAIAIKHGRKKWLDSLQELE